MHHTLAHSYAPLATASIPKDEISNLRQSAVVLQNQVSTLISENNRLLAENQQLNQKMRTSSVHTPELSKNQIETLILENHRLNDIILDLQNRNKVLTDASLKSDDLKTQNAALLIDNEHLRRELLTRSSYSPETNSKYMNELQNKLALIAVENSHLMEVIQEKDKEVERLRTIINGRNDSDKELANLVIENNTLSEQIDTLKKQCQSLANSLKNQEQIEHHIQSLVNEVQHLNSVIQEKNREIEGWANRYKALENSFAERQGQLAKEVEKKFIIIAKENERLNNQISIANRSVETLKNDLETAKNANKADKDWKKQKDTTINDLKQSLANANDQLKQRSKEAEDWKRKCFNRDSEVAKVAELEKRVIELTGQNQHLNEHLDANIKQLHEAQLVVLASADLEKRCELLVKEHHHLNSLLKQKNEEIKILENNMIQNDPAKAIGECEAHITVLAAENETLNKMIAVKNKDIEALNEKLKTHAKTDEMINLLEQKMMELVHENQKLANEAERGKSNESLMHKVALLEEGARKVVELEDKIEMLATEHEDMGVLLDAKTRECDEYRRKLLQLDETRMKLGDLETKFDLLQGEADRLQIVNTEKTREIESLRHKLSIADRTAVKVRELETRNEILTSENDLLTHNIKEREDEIYSWRQKYEHAAKKANYLDHDNHHKELEENRIKTVESRIKTSSPTFTSSPDEQELNEIHELRRKLAEYESNHVHTDEDETRKLFEEIDRLSRLYRTAQSECDAWKARVNKLELNEHRMGELEGRINILASENENLNYALRDKSAELEVWKQKYEGLVHGGKMNSMEYESQITMLEGEILKLNGDLQDKNREIQRLNSLVHRSDRQSIDSHFQRVEEMMNEIESLNQLLRSKDSEINDLRNKLTTMQVKFNNVSAQESEVEALTLQVSRLQDELRLREGMEATRLKKSGLHDVTMDMKIRGLEAISAENADLRAKCRNLEDKIHALEVNEHVLKKSAVNQGSQDLKSQINLLTIENEKLHDAILKKTEEVENWKIKWSNAEKNTEDLQKRYRNLEIDNAKLASSVKVLHEESDFLKSKAVLGEQHSMSITDLQNKLYIVTAENERLLLENESLKVGRGSHNDLKLSDAERITLQRENAALKQKIDQLNADNVKLAKFTNNSTSPMKENPQVDSDNQVIRSQNQLWDGINVKGAIAITLLTSEIERLHEVIVEIEMGNNEQIEEIRNECQRLVDQSEERVIELELEIDRLRLKDEDGHDRYEQVDEEDYQDHDQENQGHYHQ